ncbi:hypothetical protein U1Q18_026334 [Sarracenia purpurea var. burkii]
MLVAIEKIEKVGCNDNLISSQAHLLRKIYVTEKGLDYLLGEKFLKTSKDSDQIEIDRNGFETWRNMSKQERLPFVLQAEKVNSEYVNALLQDVEGTSRVDDEADSAEVGKYDLNYEDYASYDDSENSDGYESFLSESSENFGTDDWYSSSLLFIGRSELLNFLLNGVYRF